MKKLLLVLLAMFMFSVIGSYANNDGKILKDIVNTTEMVSDLPDEPVYWEGRAYGYDRYDKSLGKELYIYVYQAANQCNSYVAYATRILYSYDYDDINPPYRTWVKENPEYDANAYSYQSSQYKYYITYQGGKYYFNMD